jgi:hypothetical protein
MSETRQSAIMSALPPKADIAERDRHVRFVPIADIRHKLVSTADDLGICGITLGRQFHTQALPRASRNASCLLVGRIGDAEPPDHDLPARGKSHPINF